MCSHTLLTLLFFSTFKEDDEEENDTITDEDQNTTQTLSKPSDLAVIPNYAAAAPLATEEEISVSTQSPETETKDESSASATSGNINNKQQPRDNKVKNDDVEADEFQDEIQFDPTISSGQLGFREGDFRNTPIKLGDRSESVQPTTPVPLPPEHVIEAMTPTEAESLLSTKIAEKNVISDEQAQEVSALLTPDKELPPTPIDALRLVYFEVRLAFYLSFEGKIGIFLSFAENFVKLHVLIFLVQKLFS